MKELKIFVIGLLKSNNIEISKKTKKDFIINKIADYIEALIFNVITIASIISILNGEKIIKEKNIEIIKSYIQDRCSFKYRKSSSMKGGTFNTASFYGIEESMYKVEHEGTDLLGVDWSNGIARSQIGGGKNKKPNMLSNKYIKNCIKHVLKYHNISCSNKVLSKLVNIIDYHIKCLIKCIKQCGSDLNMKCLKSVVNKNKILQPMK